VPRYAAGTASGDTPANYVQALWAPLLPICRDLSIGTQQWPMVYGFALQELFQMAAGQHDLTILTRVAMDSAVSMAKLKQS
jgi:hypothetical protein